MRLALSNDEWIYVQQNDIKLVYIDGYYHVVGDECLYGISESGTRYRINPSNSTYLVEEYEIVQQVVDTIYDVENDTYDPVYADIGVWTPTEMTLDINYAIPTSMNANDTFNFDNFSVSYLLTFFLAIFVLFRIFVKK